jgi:hypothetical protein
MVRKGGLFAYPKIRIISIIVNYPKKYLIHEWERLSSREKDPR